MFNMLLAANPNPQSVRDAIKTGMGLRSEHATFGGSLSLFIDYGIIIGGLILFVMIVWGGFEMLAGASDPKSQEAGRQRITAALIGFIILFCSYWIAQLAEYMFGVNILNN